MASVAAFGYLKNLERHIASTLEVEGFALTRPL